MQSHGIALSFHREMTDSSRELVGPDITGAVSFKSYPRFIKGGFQDYEGLGIKRSAADSKHVPSPQCLLETRPESGRIFEINWHVGRSFQIEAIEHRGTSGGTPRPGLNVGADLCSDFSRYQRRQMINASSSIIPIPITSTASATGS